VRHGTTSALTALLVVGAVAMPLGAVLGRGPDGVATAATPPRPAVEAPSPRCGPEPVDAAGWNDLFARLSGAWAGGDGTTSTRLPDGRLLWLFGDTVTGHTDEDGRRIGAVGLVHNSILLTDGTCTTSVAPGHDALPGRDGTWLWPTHAVVTGRASPGTGAQVVVMAQRVARTGAGPYDFRRLATATVDLRVGWGGPVVVGAVRDIAGPDVLWGAAVAVDGSTTWVFGTRESGSGSFGRDLLLARAPTATLGSLDTWRFRTRDGWSRRVADAVVVRPGTLGVSTVLSAAVLDGRIVLVTKPQEFLDDRVVALTADRPWGPWRSRTLLIAPSTSEEPRYSPALVADPRPGRAVVVVNRTTLSLDRLLSDGTTARPTFYDVDLAG
jgi:hypothetical protein